MTSATTAQRGAGEHNDPRWLRVLAIPTMVGIGALVAVQSQLNGDLAGGLGGDATAGVAAALVSFGGGFVLLCTAAAVSRPMRRGMASVRAAYRTGRLRAWHLLGGTAGAFLVAAQGLTVGTIGVALFTVALVAGQTASGLGVDRAGVGPSGPRSLSVLRVLGAAVTVAAVGLSAAERLGGADALSTAALALALLPLVGGVGIAWQQAVNGQVSATGGPWAATWVNFAVGTTWLTVAFLVAVVVHGPPDRLPSIWWLYLGGPIGVVFISAAAALVRVHGVLVLGLCVVCGQVGASLVVDQLAGTTPLGTLTVVGAAITVLGVLLAGLGTRHRRPPRRAVQGVISDMR